MDGIKHSRQFAEMERLVSDYFHCHLAPVMSKTQAYLTKKQGEEMREYSTSLGGILSAMASAAQPMGDPYQVLKVTGEWNSKTTEDYIGMCKAEITGSKEIQQDLAYMAGQWRDTVVQEIGRKRYDELSEQLGGDLAYAYMDYRVEELMIDRLVKERMPKSSADYIIRKAAESSLLGLSQTFNRSPLAVEIEARGEAAYRPKGWEKGAGRVLGATADTVMMGGVGSWATLAKFVGADVAISAVASRFEPEKPDTLSVEECISKGVFGSERNVFTDFRKEAATVQTGGDKQAKQMYDILVKYKDALEQGKSARTVQFDSKDEQKIAKELFLLTSKPVMYVCNVDEASAATGNKYVEQVREAVKEENAEILVVAAKTEADIAELETYEDRQMFLQEVGLKESGVNRLIKSAYHLLELETFITAGEMEVKAWTYRKGWKAPQCAGVIHTDFEKGFIRAEVIKYEDYIKYGSEAAVKEAGKMGVEGKEYIVQDGDIMHFRFNV